MFDLRDLSERFDHYEKGWARRGQPALMEIVAGLKADLLRRKELIQATEGLLAARNKATQEVAERKKNKLDASELIQAQREIGEKIKASEKAQEEFQTAFDAKLHSLPNLPAPEVPEGTSAEQNQEVHRYGEPKKFSFEPLAHEVLGEKRGWFYFEKAAALTGARFAFYKGFAAKLERVLIQFMLDLHTSEHGYTEVIPPFLVNSKTLFGTGQLPKFKEDLFKVENSDYFLIPTSEVPITNFHAGDMLGADQLPLSYAGYSPCFRSEAGSYGKDLKGLIRQHQFNKVEMVKVTRAEQSADAHEAMRKNAERILELLELPYRTLLLCTGDMGFAASKTYDLEVWLPSQKAYREISSISNCEDFQARRMNARYRDGDAKPKFVHTLNGSGLALGRTVIAILENYQNADATVTIPKVLLPYFNGMTSA